ncbi:MAG TPA: antibiotic biosynthesis monooxygenase [Fimbriimonas sp.]
MYIVVSRWEPVPGHQAEFEAGGEKMHAFMREQPGIEFFDSFMSENGQVVVIHAYRDRETYDRLINAPDSAFNRKLKEVNLEQHSRWLGSERGETRFPGVLAGRNAAVSMS